uniref:Sema domain-containing protein n=1 Tax=Callorhinchus milii TaxID=7868 RepID=A0A4W3H1A1_CALMI
HAAVTFIPCPPPTPNINLLTIFLLHFAELLDYKCFNDTVYNYTTFWLEEGRGVLYVGARGAIYALNLSDISDGSTKMISWEASLAQRTDCLGKRRNTETECYNHVRFLKRFNGTHLFTCGTFAFSPRCAYIVSPNARG